MLKDPEFYGLSIKEAGNVNANIHSGVIVPKIIVILENQWIKH